MDNEMGIENMSEIQKYGTMIIDFNFLNEAFIK